MKALYLGYRLIEVAGKPLIGSVRGPRVTSWPFGILNWSSAMIELVSQRGASDGSASIARSYMTTGGPQDEAVCVHSIPSLGGNVR